MKEMRYCAPASFYSMDAAQAVAYIEGQSGLGKKVGLANTRRLLSRLNEPQAFFAKVHVAGTNGKGSTCAYMESCLREGGFKTGLYTSPYLERYHERICINGEPIDDEMLSCAANIVRTQAEEMERAGEGKPTVFELGTATAFVAFALCGVEIAVIEVGLGGRLDATNVITPLVSVIAHIGLDHVKILGSSLHEIAFEKAGIVKPHVPLVLYPQEEEIRHAVGEVCRLRRAPLIDLNKAQILPEEVTKDSQSFSLRLGEQTLSHAQIHLLGEHQIRNASLAVCALWQLKDTPFALKEETIRAGLAKTIWHGRLEYLHPRLLIDGAHNPQAARVLADYLAACKGKKIALVTAIMRDKNYLSVASLLAPYVCKAYCTCVEPRRGISAQELCAVYEERQVPSEPAQDVMEAVQKALAFVGQDGFVLVAGSLYLSGEVRRRFKELKTLFITDLDGTLLKKDGTLSENSIASLNEALDKGLLVSAASARSPYTAKKLLAPLHLQIPLILMNGVLLYDLKKDCPVYAAKIEKAVFLRVVALLHAQHLPAKVNVLQDGKLLIFYEQASEEEEKDLARQRKEFGKRIEKTQDFTLLAQEEVIFLSVYAPEAPLRAAASCLQKEVPEVSVTLYKDVYSAYWYLEICPKGIDKQSAARKLAAYTQASFLEVFGDNYNDLPLFACADRRYAVQNAVEEVKKRADEILLSNEEDGVALYLKHRAEAL